MTGQEDEMVSCISRNDYSILDRPDVLRLLFHPRKAEGPVDGGDRFREMLIPVEDDIGVGARLYVVHPTAPTILFFHGNGEIASDYDDIGPLFNRLEINFFIMDYRGYGCSNGSPTVTAMMSDCHRLFSFVWEWRKKNGFFGPLIVMGRSLGSASALELAHAYVDRIDGLVIESGFAWAGPLLRLLGVDPDRIGFDESLGFTNVEKIQTFTKPTVIIHAEFDHIIPFGDGKVLFEASGAIDKSLVKIAGANHNDIFMRGLKRYLKAIAGLAQTLSTTGR